MNCPGCKDAEVPGKGHFCGVCGIVVREHHELAYRAGLIVPRREIEEAKLDNALRQGDD